MTIFERLQTEWLKAGIAINGGADPAAIAAFELKHRVELPLAFKDYLLAMNGMAEGAVDGDLISFLSLEAIDREMSAREGVRWPDLIFAQYLIYSHLYVIRTSAPGEPAPIFATDGSQEKQLAGSFAEFVETYLYCPRAVVAL